MLKKMPAKSFTSGNIINGEPIDRDPRCRRSRLAEQGRGELEHIVNAIDIRKITFVEHSAISKVISQLQNSNLTFLTKNVHCCPLLVKNVQSIFPKMNLPLSLS